MGSSLMPASGPAAEPFRPGSGEGLAPLLNVGLTFFYVLRNEGGVFRVAWVGENITAILGYTPAEALAPDWWIERVHPDDVAATRDGHDRLLADGHLAHVYRFQHKDGTYRWVRSELRLTRDAAGAPSLIAGCWFDVTESKGAELALRASEARLQALSRRLLEVQEHERRYLACELHDEFGQLLTGLSLQLDAAARAPAGDVAAALSEARALVRDLTARIRDLSLRLRPAMLDDLGLVPALVWLTDRFATVTGIRASLEHSGLDAALPADVATAAYRIVQEALTNVARHAGVKDAEVRLVVADGALKVGIGDRGAGFDPTAAVVRSGGLPGMRERAELLGGTFSVESAPGRGTRVTARLPLRATD